MGFDGCCIGADVAGLGMAATGGASDTTVRTVATGEANFRPRGDHSDNSGLLGGLWPNVALWATAMMIQCRSRLCHVKARSSGCRARILPVLKRLQHTTNS